MWVYKYKYGIKRGSNKVKEERDNRKDNKRDIRMDNRNGVRYKLRNGGVKIY
jgi:hypothetical protein